MLDPLDRLPGGGGAGRSSFGESHEQFRFSLKNLALHHLVVYSRTVTRAPFRV